MKRIAAIVVCVLMLASTAMAQGDLQSVTAPNMVFENGYIQVVGESEAGQSRYRAKTAAKVIAQANLLSVVKGVTIAGTTTVQEGMLVDADIKTAVGGFLQGAMVVDEQFFPGEGYARVVMRLNLRGESSLYNSMASTLQQPPAALKVEKLPEFKPQAAAAPAPQPVTYDGLIIVVEGTGFKPALANRIIAENQNILFEPSKVSPQMLIERGCGGYTTTEIKAKTLLQSWGSTSPLVVKCVKVQKGTEAVVSVQDATVIFEQDQKSNILSQAKVVFVL
ncbi:hypothetical protein [Pseudodesulfovibrio indicus]|uniref:Uncharacterized protein n=2 Tax=Pseudodesulfovibrio indicus TaxID=1716143 RepID=A0AA94TKG6_9BACT|nr:hypothetical protein [Pseudodesulfovibrio indicus]TDT91898.1 hypothetical protein EDC59_101301 [Pseudodesulfovibrio indicus]